MFNIQCCQITDAQIQTSHLAGNSTRRCFNLDWKIGIPLTRQHIMKDFKPAPLPNPQFTMLKRKLLLADHQFVFASPMPTIVANIECLCDPFAVFLPVMRRTNLNNVWWQPSLFLKSFQSEETAPCLTQFRQQRLRFARSKLLKRI